MDISKLRQEAAALGNVAFNASSIAKERGDVLRPRVLEHREERRWARNSVTAPLQHIVGSEALRAQVSRGEEGTWCEFEGGYQARYEPEYNLIRVHSGVEVFNIRLSDDRASVRNIESTLPETSWPRLASVGILSKDWNAPVATDATLGSRAASVPPGGPRQADET